MSILVKTLENPDFGMNFQNISILVKIIGTNLIWSKFSETTIWYKFLKISIFVKIFGKSRF